jgi:hypothetical protein
MSELINVRDKRVADHWKLLTGVSALALAAYLSSSVAGSAEEASRPQVWIELGGSFTQLDNGQEFFEPAFTLVTPRKSFITDDVGALGKNARASWDGDLKVTFDPPETDWSFSAGIRYGRDSRRKFSHQQTPLPSHQLSPGVQGYYAAYQTASAANAESHMILDFQAGKDVGLGMFGRNGHSEIGFGIRYAQLISKSTFDIHYHPTNVHRNYYRFYASFDQNRNFKGIGPSVSWNASADLVGGADGGISFDWGVNAAALFGRQRVRGAHRAVEQFIDHVSYPGYVGHGVYNLSASPDRSRHVVVPNLGGFAAISWVYPGARVSVGYKADFFFNAIDGGIDTRNSVDRGFYGPFASISIGLGG